MGGYLGIDESNHGKVPEIFVGVYSFQKSDSHMKKIAMQKDRNSTIIPEDEIFRHVLISASIRCRANDDLIKIIAATELIRYFSGYEDGLSRVLFDGSGNESVVEDVLRMIHPLKPRVDFVPHSDQRCELVHTADNIAYNLARYYSDPLTLNMDIISNRIDVDMRKYDSLLRKYCRDYDPPQRKVV